MTGSTISHYSVLEWLGEGGMGVIYKALDSRLNRFVALKFLPPDKAPDPEHKRRFAQEARAVSALNHPNIVTIHDIASENGVDFIVMEYVQGRTFDKCIPRRGMRLAEALRFARQIAAALEAAHTAGVIHRDLKPGNVMITPDGLVKVLDFGLAKLGENTPGTKFQVTKTVLTGETLTERGTILGTVSYMSPEQAEGKPLDARSDIFSFGSLLYEMVTGCRAFEGESKLSTMAAILNSEPRPASYLASGVPRELERLIERCLRKRPAERWSTMTDVRVALEHLRQGPSGEFRRSHPRSRRLRWVTAIVSMAACITAGALYFAARDAVPDAPPRVVPLTAMPGTEWQPSFSPDGNQLVYSAADHFGLHSRIYVMYIGAGAPLRLTDPPEDQADQSPAWSPEGRWIAFQRSLPDGRTQIRLISPLGGPERIVAEVTVADTAPAGNGTVGWTPDGDWLAVSDIGGVGKPFAIFLVNVETGERRQLTVPTQLTIGDANPAFSPDGRTLLFTRNVSTVAGDVFMQPLSRGYRPEGEARRLTDQNTFPFTPGWTADGRGIVFTAGHLGVSGLYIVDLPRWFGAPSKPRRLSGGEDGITCAIASRVKGARSRLAFAKVRFDTNVWLANLSPGGRHEAGVRPLITSTRMDHNARFSPDGRRIAFESNRGGTPEIWVSDEGGSNAVALTAFDGPHSGTPRWSPDGAQIAFDSIAAGQPDIYVVPASGGTPRRLTSGSSEDVVPSWSRDGNWIYFTSNRTGRFQIWKIASESTAPEKPVQVTRNGGFGALESVDGRYLYYGRHRRSTTLWRMPVAGGDEEKVLDGLGDPMNFDLTSQGIYYTSRFGTHGNPILFRSFSGGAPIRVAESGKPAFVGLSVSPDGRSALYSMIDKADSDLFLLENFR